MIAAGVTKVNVNRDVLEGYYGLVGQKINKIPFTELLEEGVEVVAERTSHYMDVVLSSGKA